MSTSIAHDLERKKNALEKLVDALTTDVQKLKRDIRTLNEAPARIDISGPAGQLGESLVDMARTTRKAERLMRDVGMEELNSKLKKLILEIKELLLLVKDEDSLAEGFEVTSEEQGDELKLNVKFKREF
ncbi:hypothetical protein PMZ80_009606 [Knufia obscura]|uniref:Uncharacterized protein n=1 Tax=Knufia obscura TaxID=1635080 RepID=A0ABR0RCR6_9EURO|nr:hypothetical protein PMZ80_009606 [Knufia obscura]